MPSSVDDQVLDFYGELFDHLFSEPFRTRISEQRKRKIVIRQVEAAADAASSSLTRFFLNRKLSEATVEGILSGFAAMGNLLELDDIANPNVTTEEIVEKLLNPLPCPQAVQQTHDAVYRLALYTVVQVLMLVGPVMAEWQKLNFSSTFELPRRVVNRLNEISEQINARREGESDGDNIVDGFQDHPYIRNLARNPLMLSAICLVNYFEGGRLPEDRALLYRLCVEGLLHNWDQRRGIHSEFGFDEKLRTCREVALAMQADDRAECDADEVQAIFAKVLDDPERAARLLEHIRYRTGLLLERRPDVFGFAHLTFQEYLAARAVHEGNQLCIEAERLVREHNDGRWKEVIALYCGLTTTPAVRDLIERLIAQPDTESLAEVLTEAYLSAGSELAQDQDLRRRVLERVAIAPSSIPKEPLKRFSKEEIIPIANALVGTTKNDIFLSESYFWLLRNSERIETTTLVKRLQAWQSITPIQLSELIILLHKSAPLEMLVEMAKTPGLYASVGPKLRGDRIFSSQAEIALIGLSMVHEQERPISNAVVVAFRAMMPILLASDNLNWETLHALGRFLNLEKWKPWLTTFSDLDTKQELASLGRQLADHLKIIRSQEVLESPENPITALKAWANLLEGVKSKEKPFRQPVSVKTRTNRPKPRRGKLR